MPHWVAVSEPSLCSLTVPLLTSRLCVLPSSPAPAQHGRVRWRGNGLATPAELERLRAFTERLLQEAEEGVGAPVVVAAAAAADAAADSGVTATGTADDD